MTLPIEVDDQLLEAMGLKGLEGEEKDRALTAILSTLNLKVGKRLAETLDENQLDQFEQLEDDALSEWLAQNVPNFSEIIEEEAQKMRDNNQEMVNAVMGEE